MSERIVIEFNDDEKKSKADERIVISFDDAEETEGTEKTFEEVKGTHESASVQKEPITATDNSDVIEIENVPAVIKEKEESFEEKIKKSKVNSFYRGSAGINNYYESNIKFPEGIENSFRKNFSLNLEDEFFNAVLENNEYVILSSRNGNVYFIDRFKGKIREKIYFENESFEKTGIVFENKIYINSLKKIYEINNEDLSKKEIYKSEDESYIWSNINSCGNKLSVIEFNYQSKKASLKIIDTKDNYNLQEFKFDVINFVSDKICVANNCAYILFDSNMIEYDFDKMMGKTHSLDMKNDNKHRLRTDESSNIFYLNYKLFITSDLYEIFYLDLPGVDYTFKFTGIKNSYLNSAGGFGDNLFTGTLDGWKYYKISGLPVYMFEDEYENKIESISKNIIVISQKNKIVFYNLNRFQEAEGFVISSDRNKESVEIISSVISGNEIFVLTKNGIIEAFTNDKFNVHI